MNAKLTSLAIAMLGTGMAYAAAPSETRPGEWHPLPVSRFDKNVERVAPAVSADVVTQGTAQKRVAKRVQQADMSLFEGRTLYGGLISSNLWANLWLTEVPYGIYSFTVGNNPSPEAKISDMAYDFKASAWGRDNYFGIMPMAIMGILNGARYIQIDTQNWMEKSNVVHESTEGTYSLICCALTYDQTDDTYYGFRYKEDLSGLDWVKFNRETGVFDMIAAYRGKTVVLTLAPTPDGTMYYIDAEGDLYTLNKENGRTSLVGNTGVQPAAYDQSMVYDNRSGSFLWAALSNEGSVLYSVDPETAETKRVMKFQNAEQFTSIYMTDTPALPAAPAAAGRAQLKYSADGALDGNITFTVPSKTFSGDALAGKVNLDVWLDGENLKGEDVEPGTSVSIPVNLEEGNHYICVTTKNDAGWSPMRYIYQYAGFDTPIAPANAKMVFEENVNKVTWDKPEGGVNKGYVDFDNLTYDVVRMPDNVSVASGIKATEFSEPTPEALQSYYYVITAHNNGHASAPAETNRVLCGDAFPVPYYQDFTEEATFRDFFTAVDNDGNGYTWRYGYSGEIRNDFFKNQEPRDADDWLILPKVSMQKGVKYRFSMLMKIFTQSYPEDFEILIGTDANDLSTFRSVKMEDDFTEIAKEFDVYTCDFMIEEDGDYCVAVRYCTPLDQNGSLLMIRNVAIDKIGMADAPAKVEAMAITPDAEDLLQATVSFKAPSLNLQGETLSSITRIEVLRDADETPVHVFDAITPEQELSWTDTEVPTVALHTYTAVPYNEAGVGETWTEEAFIGIYTAPYSTDFSDKKYAETLWSSEDNIEDDDNGWYGWNWTENANKERYFSLYYYLYEPKRTDIWLFSPRLKMEENTVYTLNYKAAFSQFYEDMEWQVAYGESPTAADMRKLDDIVSNGIASEFETVVVNREAGRYHVGFGVSGEAKFDYFGGSLDDFSLTRRASAFAPCRMTDYYGMADKKGDLKAYLQFKTPTTNYYDDRLDASEKLTVKIYQGKDATIPTFTTEAAPGEEVNWTDEKALHGFNYYRITCENSHGTGEVLRDTIFVGRDKPEVVGSLLLEADMENANARLSWNTPETGVNGGIVLDAETKYNVYRYDPTTRELTPIAENVAEKSYIVNEQFTDAQKLFYYAVSAVNSEGEGVATASSIVLGKLYDLPFAESFPNAAVSTQLWQAIPMVQGATSAGTDNPTSQSYNQCPGPQDNDGGCAYFYNGYQNEMLVGALLVSPKIRIDKEGDNELSFWAYHYQEPTDYFNKGVIYVAVSANDAPAEIVTAFEIGGAKEEGWMEHKVNLDKYKNSTHLSVIFMGMTPGWQDVIYMDNIKLAKDLSGVTTVSAEAGDGNPALYDLKGYRLRGDAVNSGSVVIRDGKKVLVRNN